MTSLVKEYKCLFSNRIYQKSKNWQDGILKHYHFNNRIDIHNEDGNIVCSDFFPPSKNREKIAHEILFEGNQFKLPNGSILIDMDENIDSYERDISNMFKSSKVKQEPKIKQEPDGFGVLLLRPADPPLRVSRPAPIPHSSSVPNNPSGYYEAGYVPKEISIKREEAQGLPWLADIAGHGSGDRQGALSYEEAIAGVSTIHVPTMHVQAPAQAHVQAQAQTQAQAHRREQEQVRAKVRGTQALEQPLAQALPHGRVTTSNETPTFTDLTQSPLKYIQQPPTPHHRRPIGLRKPRRMDKISHLGFRARTDPVLNPRLCDRDSSSTASLRTASPICTDVQGQTSPHASKNKIIYSKSRIPPRSSLHFKHLSMIVKASFP